MEDRGTSSYGHSMYSGQHILGAVRWIVDVLTGSAAIVVATIAIAMVGVSMLSGRIDVRRAAAVVVGCFILLGAASIANGVRSFVTDSGRSASTSVTAPPPSVVQARPSEYDPYAGAALGKQ